MVTFLLSILAIAGICLMLYAAVALVQDRRFFSSAPKEAQKLLTRSHFFQRYWPEVDACEAYHKYGFNLKNQIIRISFIRFSARCLRGFVHGSGNRAGDTHREPVNLNMEGIRVCLSCN